MDPTDRAITVNIMKLAIPTPADTKRGDSIELALVV